MHAIVHGADIQDRDGGALLMATLFGAFPFLLKLYADGGYQGAEFQAAVQRTMAQVNVEIVKRSDGVRGFVILPKRWLVERSFAWLNRCRRLAKDWECLSRKALAFLRLASIRLMLRKGFVTPRPGCRISAGAIASCYEEIQLCGLPVPARDHSSGDMAVPAVHPQLARRRGPARGTGDYCVL